MRRPPSASTPVLLCLPLLPVLPLLCALPQAPTHGGPPTKMLQGGSTAAGVVVDNAQRQHQQHQLLKRENFRLKRENGRLQVGAVFGAVLGGRAVSVDHGTAVELSLSLSLSLPRAALHRPMICGIHRSTTKISRRTTTRYYKLPHAVCGGSHVFWRR